MIITLDIPDSAYDVLAPLLSKYATSPDVNAAAAAKEAHRRHISEVRRLAGLKGVRAKRIKRGLPVPNEQLIPLDFDEPIQPEPIGTIPNQPEPTATAAPVTEPEPLVSEPTPEPAPAPTPQPELFPVEEVIIPTVCQPVVLADPPQPPAKPKRPKKPKDNSDLYKPDEYPWVQGMVQPLTIQQYENACEKYGQPMIDRMLDAMENYNPLHKKSRSASRTLLRWCYEELKRQQPQFNNRNGTYQPNNFRSQQQQRNLDLAYSQAQRANAGGSPSSDDPILL